MKPNLQQSDVLLLVGGVHHDVEAVFLERDSDLCAMLIELVDAEVLLQNSYYVVLDHEQPAAVELHPGRTTSLS